MSGSKKISCEAIRDIVRLAELVAIQLDVIGFEFKYLVALVRKLFVDRFGNPVGEGWICEPDSIYCYQYVMFYPCTEEGNDKYIEVEMEDSEDHLFSIYFWHHDEKNFPVYKDGEPIRTRISLEVVENRDESNMLLDFADYNESDEEVED